MSFFSKKHIEPVSETEMMPAINIAALAAQARTLKIQPRRRTQQQYAGEGRSSFVGQGMSFKEVRQYQPGDDVRFIDWNVSARLGSTYSKVFEEEKENAFYIAIDVSKSNLFGSFESKQTLIDKIATTLAFASIQNNDKVGGMLFADTVRKVLPLRKGKEQAFQLAKQFCGFSPAGSRTDIELALKNINGIMRQPGVIFLISDFDSENYQQTLKMLAHRHEVIGIHVYDMLERELPKVGLLAVRDAETGKEIWMNTDDRVARRMYQEIFDRRVENANASFRDAGADLLHISTQEDYIQILKQYFQRRRH